MSCLGFKPGLHDEMMESADESTELWRPLFAEIFVIFMVYVGRYYLTCYWPSNFYLCKWLKIWCIETDQINVIAAVQFVVVLVQVDVQPGPDLFRKNDPLQNITQSKSREILIALLNFRFDIFASVTRCWIKKVAQMFPKSCLNNIHSSFTLVDLFQSSPKCSNLFWAPFVSEFVAKNF